MKQIFLLAFIISLGIELLAAQVPPKEVNGNCTVDGHGPYDLNLPKCLKLGADQAHTNCVLNERDSKVEVQFSFADSKKLATCLAKLKAESEDCQQAHCSLANDTPQH